MAQDLRLKLIITAENGQLKARLAKSEADVKRFGATSERASARAAKGYGKARKGVESISQQLERMQRIVGAAFAIGAIVHFAQSLTRITDEAKRVTGQLRLVTDSKDELGAVRASVYDIALATHQGVEATAQLYTRTARAARFVHLNMDNEQLLKFTRTLNEIMVLSHAPQQTVKSALFQLSQGIGENRLQGQNLRMVLSDIPLLGQKIAKGMGIGMKEFRKLAEEGKLTAKEIITALLNVSEEVNSAYHGIPLRVEQAMEDIHTSIVRSIGGMDAANGYTAALAGSMELLAKNMGPVISAFTALTTVVGASLAGRGINKLGAVARRHVDAARNAGMVARAEAKRAQQTLATAESKRIDTQATMSAIKAEQAAATSALETARGKRMEAKATLAAARSHRVGSAAIAQAQVAERELTAAQRAETAAVTRLARAGRQRNRIARELTASENALAAARTRATAAARRASVAMRGLRAAARALRGIMNLLGGPAGILLIAAGAMYKWVHSNDAASHAATTLTGKLERMRSHLKDLTKAKITLNLVKSIRALDDLKGRMQDIRGRMDALAPGSAGPNIPLGARVKGALFSLPSILGQEIQGNFTSLSKDQQLQLKAEHANLTLSRQQAAKLFQQIAFFKNYLHASNADRAAIAQRETGGSAPAEGSTQSQSIDFGHPKAALIRMESASKARKTALDAALAANKISYRKYYAALATMQRKHIAAEIKAKQAELQAIALKVKGSDGKSAPSAATQAKVAQLLAQINALRGAADATATQAANKTDAAMNKLDAQLDQVKHKLLGITDPLAAAKQKIKAQFAGLIASLKANGRTADVKIVLQLETKLKQKASGQVLLEQANKQVARFRAAQTAAAHKVQIGAESGTIAQQHVKAVAASAKTKIDAMIATAKAMHSAFGAQLVAKLQAVKAQINGLNQPLNSLMQKIGAGMTDAFARMFEQIATGTKSAGAAMRSFVVAVLRDISRILARWAAMQAIMAVGKAMSSSSTSWIAALGGALVGASGGAATGGLIRGPGTATSDSIPVRLSDGEFVVRAKAVRAVGLDTLQAINSGRIGAAMGNALGNLRGDGVARYAMGGLVTPASASASVRSTHRLMGVTVNAPISVSVEAGENMDEHEARQHGKHLGHLVRAAVLKTITDEKRPGGELAQVAS